MAIRRIDIPAWDTRRHAEIIDDDGANLFEVSHSRMVWRLINHTQVQDVEIGAEVARQQHGQAIVATEPQLGVE